MKKFFATILALVMVCTVAVTAFAETTSPVKNTKDDVAITVKGNYSTDKVEDKVVSVDVAWDEMTFTYSTMGSKVWNPLTHKYSEDSDSAGWVPNAKKIDFTNHSNTAVDVALSFVKNQDLTDTISGTFSGSTGSVLADSKLTLATAAGTTLANAPTDYVTFLPSGTVSSAFANGTNLGTITVALSEHTAD